MNLAEDQWRADCGHSECVRIRRCPSCERRQTRWVSGIESGPFPPGDNGALRPVAVGRQRQLLRRMDKRDEKAIRATATAKGALVGARDSPDHGFHLPEAERLRIRRGR